MHNKAMVRNFKSSGFASTFKIRTLRRSANKMEFPKRLHYVKPPPDESWSFLENLDWFSTIGGNSNLSFEEAVNMAASNEWEDFTLERRNDITGHLAAKHRNRETEWNKVAIGYRNYCDKIVFPSLNEAAGIIGFEAIVIKSVTWNVMSFMMEETYASWGVPRFFDKIIESLKRGKLPCGWFGDYPSGYLIEY
jgi:hypothetical protein